MPEEKREFEGLGKPAPVNTFRATCQRCCCEYNVTATVFARAIIPVGCSSEYCPTCLPAVQAERQAQDEANRLAVVASKRREWRETCGIPLHFMAKDFSNFEKAKAPNAYATCFGYADQFPIAFYPRGYGSLVLSSPACYGVGKTHLAAAIGHRILDRWNGEQDVFRPVEFLTEPEMFQRLQASYNRDRQQGGETEEMVLNRLIYKPLLILDDVGKVKRNDPTFTQRIWFAVIDGRYKSQRSIVLTTNLTDDELRDHLAEAAFDRLWEMTGGKILKIKGASYRRKGAEK